MSRRTQPARSLPTTQERKVQGSEGARVLESDHPSLSGSFLETQGLKPGEELIGPVGSEGRGVEFEDEPADPGAEDVGFSFDKARLGPLDVGDQGSRREAHLLQQTPESGC